MTVVDTASAGGFGWLGGLLRNEPRFAVTALVLAALIPATLVAMLVDARTLGGDNVWVKPLKFEIALVLYLGTLAWFAAWLPRWLLDATAYQAFSTVVVVAVMLELVWVAGAAAFGIASHYNVESAFMRGIYGLMGVLAVILTSASAVHGVAFLRDTAGPLPAPVRLGLGIGLILTFVATVIVAGYMASRTGHHVGVSGGDRVWLLGWARDAGDLRVAHFFATHALHAIPLAGLLLAATLPVAVASWGVIAVGIAYSGLVAMTFLQALAGRPFMPG